MRFEAPFRPGWTKGVQGPASAVARITFPVSTSWGGLRTPDGTMGQDSMSPGLSLAQSDRYDAVGLCSRKSSPPNV